MILELMPSRAETYHVFLKTIACSRRSAVFAYSLMLHGITCVAMFVRLVSVADLLSGFSTWPYRASKVNQTID